MPAPPEAGAVVWAAGGSLFKGPINDPLLLLLQETLQEVPVEMEVLDTVEMWIGAQICKALGSAPDLFKSYYH